MESRAYVGASRRGTGLTSMMTHSKKTPAKWNDGHQAPTWTAPPLAIANRHCDTNNQLVQNTRYRLILVKASNLDWLTRDRHAMRDLSAVAKEGSNHWVPIQDLPFDEIILFALQPTTHLDPHMSVYPGCISGRILQRSGPSKR